MSTAPQIRYPDCYGIDMSKMGDFVAFRALLNLLKQQDKEAMLQEVYEKCKTSNEARNSVNEVRALYNQFKAEQISAEIATIVKAPGINAEVEVIYQTIEDLHKACPNHTGDWYFTGNYPTAGGSHVANKAFMNFMEGKGDQRAY